MNRKMKSRNKIYGVLLVRILAVLVLAGWLCGCEDTSAIPEGGFSFRLQQPPALRVDTRGILNTIPINNVWVLQYKSDDTGKPLKTFYFSSVGDALDNGTIELNTDEAAFSRITSRFYVIANVGDALKDFKGSEADLMGKTVERTTITDQPSLLTAGPLNYTPKAEEGETGAIPIIAPLQRAYATIEMSWTKKDFMGNNMTINSVEIANVPNAMALYARGGGGLSVKYPVDADMINKDLQSVGSGALDDSGSRTFYMGENLRGMGTAPSLADKNLDKYGPGDIEGHRLDNCTYIRLNGSYTYTGATDPIGVSYTLYLGGNLMTDYNIRRGYLYKLTVNISGANSAGVRVTITDGNVIMFDEVEIIPNEVNFR